MRAATIALDRPEAAAPGERPPPRVFTAAGLRPLAASMGALWLLTLLPALAVGQSAESLPQTTAEWLKLISERRRDIYTIRIESTWQRLEDGQVVEEWEQSLVTDDLGGRWIEERGRVTKGRTPIDPTTVYDVIHAFNGAEYRELTKTWTISPREPLTRERKAALRAEPPAAVTGWLEAEPGEEAAINQRATPQRMADHWFTVCLLAAAQEQLEPTVSPLADEPGRYLVELESKEPKYGHTCRAVVDEHQGLRVVRLEMWDIDHWMQRFETTYAEREGRWVIASGRDLSWYGQGRDRHERETRFEVRKSEIGTVPENEIELPAFPVGTRVTDRLTNAVYRAGRDLDVDRDIGRLVDQARQKLGEIHKRRDEYYAWPTQARLGLIYAAAGALTGVALTRVVNWVPWALLAVRWPWRRRK